MPDLASVGAVVVLYRHDPALVHALLARIEPQVEHLVVVENGSVLDDAPPGVHRIFHEENLGLAAAQNAGFAWLRARGASHALLLDQDSLPAEDLVVELLAAERRARSRGLEPAACGPCFLDPRTGEPGFFVRFGAGLDHRVEYGELADDAEVVDVLISSGSLIRLEVLAELGGMDEELFVYHVDTEWCLRARHAKRPCVAARRAFMEHRVGDGLSRWPASWGRVHVRYSATATYFILRNALLLTRRSYVPMSWLIRELIRVMALMATATLRGPRRAARLTAALRGLVHGILGRGGAPPPGATPPDP